MFYLLAPSGTPISLSEIARTVLSRLGFGTRNSEFAEKLERFTSSKHVWLLGSGRVAQYVLLKSLVRVADPGKCEVVIPSWTCYSVAAAIARAGLTIRLVDIDPQTMDYDYVKLRRTNLDRVLAITACNLFGIASDWNQLRAIVRDHPVFLIDDAAQSFGTMVDGRFSGTLGDGGFFSLDRGKNLSTWAGGVLMTRNDDLAPHIDNIIESLPTPGIMSESLTAVKLVIYSMLLRPRCYWSLSMVPFVRLGETVYDERFALTRLSKLQQCAGSLLVEKLDQLNAQRATNSLQLIEGIQKLDNFKISGHHVRAGTYLRLPVLAIDESTRDRAVHRLRKCGVVASTMYPTIIRDIPGIERRLASLDENYPGGRQVVARLFTLPTHAYVCRKDIDRMIAVLSEV